MRLRMQRVADYYLTILLATCTVFQIYLSCVFETDERLIEVLIQIKFSEGVSLI